MNSTSRAIIGTLISSDDALSADEKRVLKQLMDGIIPIGIHSEPAGEALLLTQKEAAKALSVSRVTIWRLVREGALKPIELLPGTLRYSFVEIASLAANGLSSRDAAASHAA